MSLAEVPTTERIVLRSWSRRDKAPFARMNANREVMEHFPSALTRRQSDALADRFQAGIDERGWGGWVVERREDGAFLGFVGLVPVSFEASFTPAVEVGWRLDRSHWGRGYATEGARAALDYAFGKLGLERVVSFTACTNRRSEAVMIRIGMTRVDEFDHPRLPLGHRLRRHVLYEVRPPAERQGDLPFGARTGQPVTSATR
ncbi:MAG TPA: GNAT family N-acetyltransferase [Acidimicrobiales bacterium]|nr:GNAT family N-acetyltransferase [Acidimicrobiales bacterium]